MFKNICVTAALLALAPAFMAADAPAAAEMPLVYDKEDTGAAVAKPPLPEFSALPSIPYLPDPFSKADGTRITTRDEWRVQRAEIKAMIERYDVGEKPGKPSLFEAIRDPYSKGRSIPGQGAAATSALLAHLRKGHQGVKLPPDALERLITWMDCYGQRQGHFSPAQERALIDFRRRCAPLLAER